MPATGVDWRRALRKLADGEEEGVFLVDVDRLKAQGLRAASADSAAAGKEEDIARTVLKAHDREYNSTQVAATLTRWASHLFVTCPPSQLTMVPLSRISNCRG